MEYIFIGQMHGKYLKLKMYQNKFIMYQNKGKITTRLSFSDSLIRQVRNQTIILYGKCFLILSLNELNNLFITFIPKYPFPI